MRRFHSAANAGIQPPQVPPPSTLTQGSITPMEDGATYSQLLLTNHDFSHHEADDILLEQVHCKRVNMSHTHLTTAHVLDARFETCDLAGAEWEQAQFRRIELRDCRLVGTKFIRASLDDVCIKACSSDLALFWESTFKSVRFEHCSLQEAAFEGANLSGVVFHQCNLQNADLRNATLVGTDFRGSNISGIQVGIKDLQGAIMDPSQVVHLAGVLGITVKMVDE